MEDVVKDKKKTETFIELQQLSEKIQLFFSEEELSECEFFIDKIDLLRTQFFPVSKKKDTVENYLFNLWGKKIPFLTLSKLDKLKKDYYDIQIGFDILKKNAFFTLDNYLLVSYK